MFTTGQKHHIENNKDKEADEKGGKREWGEAKHSSLVGSIFEELCFES